MGLYLTPGHTYSDTSPNNAVNGANLNEHVSEAVLKPTSISSQTLKDPAALSDEILINDGGSFRKVTWQQVYALMIQPGAVIQTAYAEYTASTYLTNVIPLDGTIPQNTEGTEIISLSITPRFATSTILCSYGGCITGNTTTSTGGWMAAALFKDSTANALVSEFLYQITYSGSLHMGLCVMDSPATTSLVTYKVRLGPGTAGDNVLANANVGGSGKCVLTLQEIKV